MCERERCEAVCVCMKCVRVCVCICVSVCVCVCAYVFESPVAEVTIEPMSATLHEVCV